MFNSVGICEHLSTEGRRRGSGHSRPSDVSRSTTRPTLRADRGYVGVLAYNPVHGDYKTIYPHSEPYDLAELAEPIPGNWRRPALASDLATAPGRNCHLFAALCKLALRCSDDGLLTWARILNREYSIPLPEVEVMGTVRSVCDYRARWRVRGHQQRWLWKQAARGRRGGLVAKAARHRAVRLALPIRSGLRCT